jgi:hypothetical protein
VHPAFNNGIKPCRNTGAPLSQAGQKETTKRTVKDITFDLLRQLELTVIVGNPGSTEEIFQYSIF